MTENRRSRRQRREVLGGYGEWLEPFLAELLRVVSPTGSLMLNLGRVMRNGEQHPYHLDVLARARAMGWKWLDEIIWDKPNALAFSERTYLHSKHEYVWWLARSTDALRTYHGGYADAEPEDYPGYDPEARHPHSEETRRRAAQPYISNRRDERYAKRSSRTPLHPDGARPGTVVRVSVGGSRGILHPAVMSRKLARHLVRLNTPVGGVVLDPFAGSGTTGVEALPIDRRFLGVEMDPGYAEEARERLHVAANTGVQSALALDGGSA